MRNKMKILSLLLTIMFIACQPSIDDINCGTQSELPRIIQVELKDKSFEKKVLYDIKLNFYCMPISKITEVKEDICIPYLGQILYSDSYCRTPIAGFIENIYGSDSKYITEMTTTGVEINLTSLKYFKLLATTNFGNFANLYYKTDTGYCIQARGDFSGSRSVIEVPISEFGTVNQ